MKIVFFGGGGFRTLPLARSVLATVPDLRGGEIFLYDINADRVQAMGRMIEKSPELADTDCEVRWGTDLDEALPGADMVNFSLMAGSPRAFLMSQSACRPHGFMGSDQLSPSGAFLALKGGPIALACARAMEKHCPHAWLTIFANPVAVLSAAVNNHTKIRALGICGGFTNHNWDLARLTGRDEFDPDFDVDAAGVNHLSFIIRGTYRGEDLFQVLERHIGPDWQPPEFRGYRPEQVEWFHFGLRKLIEVYQRFGVTVFSTEGDGMMHLFFEEMFERDRKRWENRSEADEQADAERRIEQRKRADREFQQKSREDLDEDFWKSQERPDHHISVRIAQALGGGGRRKIVASHPCRGAVDGFKERTVLEYSQYLGPEGLEPVEDLYVPDPFHGLISSLATHQTLLADAIATEDPRILFQALYAYPVKQNTRASRQLYRELLEINKDEIPAAFQAAKQYL